MFVDMHEIFTRESKGNMETSVYRKATHTGLYLNWNSNAPNTWKEINCQKSGETGIQSLLQFHLFEN